MNKLVSLFFMYLFHFLVVAFYLSAEPTGLFSGYRLENKKHQENEDSLKFNFAKRPQLEEKTSTEEYYEEDSTYKNSDADTKKTYFSKSVKEENSNNQNSNKPEVNSQKIFTSQPSTSRIVNEFNYENKNSNTNTNTNATNKIKDSGVPVNLYKKTPSNRTSSPYRKQQINNSNNNLGSVDTSIYYGKLPSNYPSSTSANVSNSASANNRILSNKKNIKYPNFLLFANDVICTTQAGIIDGMIFYTPHGTYKLKGNLLISSNNSYLISGNRIWLDDMIYYFDDSGVYLDNKIYNFKNNVLYKDGVKYQIEGTVVVTEGISGNHRCIVSELVE